MILIDRMIPELDRLLAGTTEQPIAYFDQWHHDEAPRAGVTALFVRSTTTVNAVLLAQLPDLRFVASATSGIDHLDVKLLEERGVRWAHAPGCNAQAVADYVFYALGLWARDVGCQYSAKFSVQSEQLPRVAIMGMGQVGQRVAANLNWLGVTPDWIDPFQTRANLPRELRLGRQHELAPDYGPNCWLAELDVLCMHTPLTGGSYATQGWLNQRQLALLADGSLVLNAGRGETMVAADLPGHAKRLQFCFDVWPGEPDIEPGLIAGAKVATPHIAGHSELGKLNGSFAVYKAWCKAFKFEPRRELMPSACVAQPLRMPAKSSWIERLQAIDQQCCGNFDLAVYDRQMRKLNRLGLGAGFLKLRKGYRQHPEFRLLSDLELER